jgi:hypothetical protein
VDAYYLIEFNDNLVQGNQASRAGDSSGGGLYAVYLKEAYRNQIIDNSAKRGGGLYYKEYIGRQTFADNLVARNWALGTDLATLDGGGGISSAADRLEIQGNTFDTNNALAGGGVLITGGDLYEIEKNEFEGNWAVAGGGMFVFSATGTIKQNAVFDNHAIWYGGGMYLSLHASPQMDRNLVVGNQAGGYNGLAAGGVMLDVGAGTRITLTNHIVANNSIIAGNASGVHCLSGSCTLIHNTIVDNKLGSDPGEGVRIGALDATNLLWNNILVGHSTGVVVNGATVLFGNNDYFDNAVSVSGASEGSNPYHLNPWFVDRTGGDYHLTSVSGLIDAGNSSYTMQFDFEGEPRLKNPDIGADEFIFAHLYLPLNMYNWINWGEEGP